MSDKYGKMANALMQSVIRDLQKIGYTEDEATYVAHWYDENLFSVDWEFESTPKDEVLRLTGYESEGT